MGEPLWPLLELEANSETALQEAYRRVYVETYVQGDIKDWAGRRVRFHYNTFDHAFSESRNYRTSAGVHEVPFSLARAKRMLWIREALACSGGTIEVRGQVRQDSRGRSRRRRTLIVVEERYVVVLQPSERRGQDEGLEFVTAFNADRAFLDKIRRESALIETKKKPQSYGD